jgi:hypothetical protein
MDSLQVGNSRFHHDTTTSFGHPYNIVTNAQYPCVAICPQRPSLYKRSAAG